jgi:hypothetical protein
MFGTCRKEHLMNVVVRRFTATALICCLVLAGAGTTRAQNAGGRGFSQPRRMSSVLGANVTLERGGDVGKVEDVVLNDSGCPEYVVIRYEDGYVAVPWTFVTVNFEDRVVRLDVTRDRFRDIPTFSRDRWPDFAGGEYRKKLRKVFGADFERRGRRTEENAERREELRDQGVERREEGRDDRRDKREGTRDNPATPRPPAERPGPERPRPEAPADRPGARPSPDREPPTRDTPPDRPPERK